MAERRMIRKDLLDKEAFSSLPLSSQLLYIGIILNADDEGCFRADPKYWSRKVFYNKRQGAFRVGQMLEELHGAGLIITDLVNNEPAGFIPDWFKMQTLSKNKSKPSEYASLLTAHGITPRWGLAAQGNGMEEKQSETNFNKDSISTGRENSLTRPWKPSNSFSNY